MPDTPYTVPRKVQFRGPSTSDDYNARIEEHFKDLMVLYNRLRLYGEDQDELRRRILKEQQALAITLQELEERVAALEDAAHVVTFFDESKVDNDRFVEASEFHVPEVSRATIEGHYGLLTLPKIPTSSFSKLTFTNSEGEDVIPGTLETRVLGDQDTADDTEAFVDTSYPEYAIQGSVGRIWERNVVVDSPDPNGAEMSLYVKLPEDLFTTENSNTIVVHPFPSMSVDLMSVAYTINKSPLLLESDGYVPVNTDAYHSGDPDAVRWTPPGGWEGDAIVNCGPKMFVFDPVPVTAVRLRLRQKDYYEEAGRYIYSYGLSRLDVRQNKYTPVGKAMVRFDAPDGETISSIDDVQPLIWNLPRSAWDEAFQYRVIWETDFNSNVYTEEPVSLSQRVRIEVTLNATSGNGSPALSGLTVSYS